MKTIQIKQLSEEATLPTRHHSTDAGLDIYASETIVLKPQEKRKLATGIAVNIPPGYVGFLTSRSGVSSETHLVIETGKIDAGFIGEMKINIKNDEQYPELAVYQSNKANQLNGHELLYDIKGRKIDNGNPYQVGVGRTHLIKKGDKIAQLVITPIVTPRLEITDQFDNHSERGEKGFGSSDEKVYPQ